MTRSSTGWEGVAQMESRGHSPRSMQEKAHNQGLQPSFCIVHGVDELSTSRFWSTASGRRDEKDTFCFLLKRGRLPLLNEWGENACP